MSTLEESLRELKHSVYMHVTLQAGPTPQLAAFLVKLLDMLDDMCEARSADPNRAKEITDRVGAECAQLSFHIIEGAAVWLQHAVDERKMKAIKRGEIFPADLQQYADRLMVLIGQSRSLPDKIIAKNAVLRGMAETLRALQAYTKSEYPEIRDSKNSVL